MHNRKQTNARDDIGRFVSNERGRTDGAERNSAVSAVKPGLRRKQPTLKRTPNLTRADLEAIPASARVHVTERGIAKLAEYRGKPASPHKAIQRDYAPIGGHDSGTPLHKNLNPANAADAIARLASLEARLASKPVKPGRFDKPAVKPSRYAGFRARADKRN